MLSYSRPVGFPGLQRIIAFVFSDIKDLIVSLAGSAKSSLSKHVNGSTLTPAEVENPR